MASDVKCDGCGAELPLGAKNCPGCGRPVSFEKRAESETAHRAEETGKVAGKIGQGIVDGVKGLASGAKKGLKGSGEK